MTKKIPELRFAGFEGDWEEKNLGDIGSIYSGLSGKTKEDFGKGNAKFIEFSNVLANAVTNEDMLGQIDIDEKQNTVKSGDILFNSSSETPEEVGMSSVWTHDIDNLYLNSFCIGFRPNIKLDNYFIAYLLRNGESRKQIILLAQGISRYNISRIGLTKIKILLPSLPEQEKIGELFETLDACLEDQAAYVKILKKSKKVFLQKLFPQKGAKVPELRFPGFEGDWEEHKISNLFSLTRGNVLSKKKIRETSDDEYKYPVYSSQTLNNGLLGYYNDYLYEDSITWTTDGANAGTVSYREGKFYSTNVNGVLLSSEGYSNKAVAEILNKEAYKYVSRVGNPKLMNNVMADIKIFIPSLAEQEKIGAFFKALDYKIEKEEDKLESFERLKRALLQKVFV